MPTPFTHAYVALAAGAAVYPRRMPAKFWWLAMACSAGPDLDVGFFAYGFEYWDFWGHRGMMHSLLFALAVGLFVATYCFRRDAPRMSRKWLGLAAFFFVVTASHGFFDAFTDGGLGIAFFAPFDNTRYFMPWQPIMVTEFDLKNIFSGLNLRAMASELRWVWLPVTLAAAPIITWRWRSSPALPHRDPTP